MWWLNRRYRLDEPVGAGGSGVVWRAHDARLRRPVAVKTTPTAWAAHRRKQLLQNEAVLAASVRHPNVVSVYDYGETANGIPFLVLELVEGRTLAERLASHGALHHAVAAAVCGAVASALAAIHARGLVHGDLKPENVMIGPAGPKLLDLGTASRIQECPDDRPVIAGTQAYMAPEQTDTTPGPEADMYAFGLLLRECLSARRSRPDADPPEVHAAKAGSWPWLPDTVPGPLTDLVTACLSPEPTCRPSAGQAVTALRAFTPRRTARRRNRSRPIRRNTPPAVVG